MAHVNSAWDSIVEKNQAGLVDAKHTGPMAPLSSTEAWHHFQANEAGVVDSGRFLITFGMIPSVQSGGSPLHIAASLGDLKRIKALLEEEGSDVNVVKGDGTTPLHAASTMSHTAAVKLLLEEGANVEARGKNGATPLMMSAAMGHLEVARALLDGGAALDMAHGFAGTTALHFAAEMGRDKVLSLLCERGANVHIKTKAGGIPLHTAADTNQSASVQILLGHPCNSSTNHLLAGDSTPVYLAAQRGFTGVVTALVKAGVDVDFAMPTGSFSGALVAPAGSSSTGDPATVAFYSEKNTEVGNGATALHAAVENGHIGTTIELLRLGAKQTSSMQGATPLITSLQYKHPSIALVLLNHPNPRINAKVPIDGASALFVAAGEGYSRVVSRIVELGGDMEITNNHGATPLSHAVMRGEREVMEYLIESGANRSCATHHGLGLLHVAIERGLRGITEGLLRQHGLDANSRGRDGMTPLHWAARSGNVAIASILLSMPPPMGASTEAETVATQATPLLLAAQRGHVGMIRRLIAAKCRVNPVGGPKLYGAGPLYLATQGGHIAAVKVLLKEATGTLVDARLAEVGATALFLSAERGFAAIAGVLIRAGADTNGRNTNGLTPLHIACLTPRLGSSDVIRILLANGALISPIDEDGWDTPLIYASRVVSRHGQYALEALLKHGGADLDYRNKRGETAVIAAARASNRAALSSLLEAGARCDITSMDGASVRSIVFKHRNFDLFHIVGRFQAKCGGSLAPEETEEPPQRESPLASMPPDLVRALVVLGLPSDASWKSIKLSHKKLRKEFHPDSKKSGEFSGERKPDGAKDQGDAFVAVNRAFAALSRAHQAGAIS